MVIAMMACLVWSNTDDRSIAFVKLMEDIDPIPTQEDLLICLVPAGHHSVGTMKSCKWM